MIGIFDVFLDFFSSFFFKFTATVTVTELHTLHKGVALLNL